MHFVAGDSSDDDHPVAHAHISQHHAGSAIWITQAQAWQFSPAARRLWLMTALVMVVLFAKQALRSISNMQQLHAQQHQNCQNMQEGTGCTRM